MRHKEFLRKFQSQSIAVVGDIMLDKYIFGKVYRISPEAPVPVIDVERERYVPGGAANAAANVATLGGDAHLFGIVGNDLAKEILLDAVKSYSIDTSGVVSDARRQTIQKIRVVGQNQQLIRIDYEDKEYLDDNRGLQILKKIKEMERIDVMLISDYAKGSLSKELLRQMIAFARENKIPVIVDPKPRHMHFYKGCSLLTPNKTEAEEMSGIKLRTEQDVERAGTILRDTLDCDVLLTRGEEGMSLFERNANPVHIPTVAKEVFDVSGAGDTVIATLSLAIASGATLKEAAMMANQAAGIKVSKLGTAPVLLKELEAMLS